MPADKVYDEKINFMIGADDLAEVDAQALADKESGKRRVVNRSEVLRVIVEQWAARQRQARRVREPV
jgi:predicted DNA-binding ribbon-helix-helix protein